MTFPVGCVTRALTAQAPFAEDGAPLDAELVITASATLIWAATGKPLQPTYRAHGVDPVSGLLTLVIPTTNQASGSWLKGDGSGAPIASNVTTHSHTYSGTLTYTDEETGQRVVRTVGPFVHPVGDGSPLPVEKLTNWSGSTAGPIFVPDAITAATAAQASAAASANSAAASAASANTAATNAANQVATSLNAGVQAAAASAEDAASAAQWVEDHWPGPSGNPPLVTEFTFAASWTVPTAVNYGFAKIEAIGGGGGGGSISEFVSTTNPDGDWGCGGGGGGGYDSVTIPFSVLLDMVNGSGASPAGKLSIAVGAGGAAALGFASSASAGGYSHVAVSYSDLPFTSYLVRAGGGGGGAYAGSGGGGGGAPIGTDLGNGQSGSPSTVIGGVTAAGGGIGGAPASTWGGFDPGAAPASGTLGGGGGGAARTSGGTGVYGRGGDAFSGGGGGGAPGWGGGGSLFTGVMNGQNGGVSRFGGFGGGGGGASHTTFPGARSGGLGSSLVHPKARYGAAGGAGGASLTSRVPQIGLPGSVPGGGGGGASGGDSTVPGVLAKGGAGGAGLVRITLY